MFYFTYRLGAWLLNIEVEVDGIELSWAWLSENLTNIGYPLIFGSLVCGWVAGVTGFVLVRVAWRFHVISRWRARSPPQAPAEPRLSRSSKAPSASAGGAFFRLRRRPCSPPGVRTRHRPRHLPPVPDGFFVIDRPDDRAWR